jgi:hypothetical protein
MVAWAWRRSDTDSACPEYDPGMVAVASRDGSGLEQVVAQRSLLALANLVPERTRAGSV